MTFTKGMKSMSCTSCFCLVQPGEQVTEYHERAGSATRVRAHHADYADCQSALARESLRYSRITSASGDGRKRYMVTHDRSG